MTNLLLHIGENEPIKKAFELIRDFNVHAIPILNKEGKIVGDISVSDLQVSYLYIKYINIYNSM